MKEHPYTGELGCFTAYMRTNLPHTRNDLPETHPIQPPPSESPLHFADRMAESVIVGYYISAEVPFPRRKQPGCAFAEPFSSVRRTYIAHGWCERGFQRGGSILGTRLWYKVVCVITPCQRCYTFLKCKKSHANTLTVRTWDLMLPRPNRVLVTNPDKQLLFHFSKTVLRTPRATPHNSRLTA